MPFSETDPRLIAIRAYAQWLMLNYVPSDWGEKEFDYILAARQVNNQTVRDYAEGKGTTCGYLCHWMLWRLGVTSRLITVEKNKPKESKASLVNRTAPGYTYTNGANIINIWNAGFKPFIKATGTKIIQTGQRPRIGDIVFIKDTVSNAQDTEHVLVFHSEEMSGNKVVWNTVESGQTNSKKKQCCRYVPSEYVPKGRNLIIEKTKAYLTEHTSSLNHPNMTRREIMGWLSLAELSYCYPSPPPDLAIEFTPFPNLVDKVLNTSLPQDLISNFTNNLLKPAFPGF